MRTFEFGLYLHGDRDRDRIESARRYEDLGFDYVHMGEHLLFHDGVGLNAMIALAAAAAVTTRIRLVTAVTHTPLYPASILGWLASSLDRISNGRFELGVGVGGEYAPEFELAGIDLRERGTRTDETLEMLGRLWSEDRVSFEGHFQRFHDIGWQPKPVRSRLPIWVGGRGKAGMRRAARFGDGWMPYMYSVEKLADSIQIIHDEAEGLGRDPASIKMSVAAYVNVDHDSAKAKQVAAETVSSIYRQDLGHTVDRYHIAGTPDECRARLRDYHDAGARTAFLTLACPAGDTEEMADLLVREVFPEFREGPG